MARTALTPVTLTANDDTADPTGDAFDDTNDHKLAVLAPLGSYIFRLVNTTSGTADVTFVSGDNPPGGGGPGDLVVTCADATAADTVTFVGPLDGSRFMQDDGTVSINVEDSTTGFITALLIPTA